MRVGFAVPQSGPWATPGNMRRVAVRAEQLGYSELWAFQRVLYPEGHQMGPTYRSVQDPLVALSFVAGITSRIRLGVAVVNAFVQPVVMAKQLASLQLVSEGRLTAGVGLGWLPEEFEAAGVGFERRGRRGEEFVEVLRKCWTEDVIEHQGDFYQIPPSHQDPKPSPLPPILLGGSAEPALRRAGRIGDGWVSASREDLSGIASKIYIVKEAAREVGRDPSGFRYVCRGVTRVRAGQSRDRRPLTGSYDQIRADVDRLAASGVTDVFHDLNFDTDFVTLDAKEAMRRAEEALEALAP